jgi:peptide/nickel transport system permease protein
MSVITTDESAPTVASERDSASSERPVDSGGTWRRLLRQPIAVVCLLFFFALLIIAIVSPLIWPDVATQQSGDLSAIGQGPSRDHPLGTDTLGRDVLQRLLVGTRVTVIGALEAVIVALAIGVPVGLVAGYLGGTVDRVIGWLTDLVLSMPGLIVILVVVAVFHQSTTAAMLAFGVLTSPSIIRVVRSASLPVRNELYIDAVRVAGLSDRYIIFRHVLPRIAGPVIVQASLLAGVAVLVQTGLAFLHLVVPVPAPSWGSMMADGWSTIHSNTWLILPPGVATTITILAFSLFGDAVRDATTARWQPTVKRRPQVVPFDDKRERVALNHSSPPREGALLRLRDVSIGVPSDSEMTTLVEEVSFDVLPGETVAIMGESGCGKTVAARAILGLLPGAVQQIGGSIVFDGTDISRLSEQDLRRLRGSRIALISQDPMVSLNPSFRVGWQLAEVVRRHTHVSRKTASERAIELLRQVELTDPEQVVRRYPHELSGGMAQRVSIARALAGEPDLLIADEPTTALDVTLQAEILALLRRLKEDTGMAILLVTHDWGVAADLADHVIVMYAGQVVERGPVGPLFAEPLHPYTQGLIESNPHHAVGRGRLSSIPGTVVRPGEWPVGCHFQDRCKFAIAACSLDKIPVALPAPGRETRCIRFEELKENK